MSLPARIIDVLMLEDSPVDADLIEARLTLARIPHRIWRVVTRQEFVAALTDRSFDLILADYTLPSFDGISALRIARVTAEGTPFIFVSGTLGEEIAIEMLKLGATDYVLKQRLGRLPSAISRAMAEAAEREQRRHAEAQQRLLVAELSHRVKNTLATVLSMAQQTIRSSTSFEIFERAFIGRLRALSETHTLLLQGEWQPAELRVVLAQVLKPFLDGRSEAFELDGPEVQIEPRLATSLSMVLHELATNAVRHGALSRSGGRVAVDWRLTGDDGRPRLSLTWTERDGPPLSLDSPAGFGTTLIRQCVRHELDGTVSLTFPPSGVVCEITVPLGVVQAPEPA